MLNKYKIVEFKNGHGKPVYRIKERFCFMWFYHKYYNHGGNLEKFECDTKEEATNNILSLIDSNLNRKRSKVSDTNLLDLPEDELMNEIKRYKIKRKLKEKI